MSEESDKNTEKDMGHIRPDGDGFKVGAPLIISILVFGWVFLIHLSPDIYHTFPTPITLYLWRIVAIAILLLMLAAEAMRMSHPVDVSSSEEEVTEARSKKNMVDYPPKVTGVIYADTYLPMDEDTDIKIRTMLARACPLCDKEDECWKKAGSNISREDFLANMECKEGLREIGAA